MTLQGQNLLMLETVADALGYELLEKLVFVGGCTTVLHITDPITLSDVRITDDVDLIVDLVGYGEWAHFQERLRERGFSESSQDKVICRMRLGNLKVDFMPVDEKILGFSNRWYAIGIETAVSYSLTDNLQIKHLTPELFLATKLEAYVGRGNNDPLSSHDLEDVLLVLDGREELVAEVRCADQEVRDFIASQFRELKAHDNFDNFLEGNIRGARDRVDDARDRIEALAHCNDEAPRAGP